MDRHRAVLKSSLREHGHIQADDCLYAARDNLSF
jgi:hypothetical protein